MAKKTQKTEKQEEIKGRAMTEEAVSEKKNGKKEHEEAVTGQEKAAEKAEESAANAEKEPKVADNRNEEAAEKQEEKSKEEELGDKLAEMQDKYLRLSAEYDNYRKRTLREKMELQDVVREEVFVKILPVVDDLERAMDSVSNAKDIEAVKAGMELIYNKFTKYLDQQGVKEIEAVGKELNTDQHEAITKIPVDAKKQKGKIVDVVEKGYTLRDKVIRFAKVVIGE